MKVNSDKAYERQTATQAMTLWETARKMDKPIGTDSQGNITVVYGSAMDKFNKPSMLRNVAKQCLLDKIKMECGPFLGIKNDVFAQVMKTSLPSIERFIDEGYLGSLPTEWQTFQKSQSSSAQLPRKIEIKRLAEAKKIADLLPPGMQIDIRDESVSIFTHQFSEASQDRLEMEWRLLAHEEKNKTLPLSNQFIKDANRSNTYKIQTPVPPAQYDHASPNYANPSVREALIGSSQLTPRGAEVVGRLYDFCEGDLAMMTTLSCFLSQSSINKFDDEDAREMSGPSGFRPILNAIDTSKSTQVIYEVNRNENGDVIIGLKFLTKASMLASGLPNEEWPFQPSPDSDTATENNFNRRTNVVMVMKASDLKIGHILPRVIRRPETTYVLDFNWKAIDKIN